MGRLDTQKMEGIGARTMNRVSGLSLGLFRNVSEEEEKKSFRLPERGVTPCAKRF